MTTLEKIKNMNTDDMANLIIDLGIAETLFSDVFCNKLCPCKLNGNCTSESCPDDFEMVKACLNSTEIDL